nr:L,D-transpeptidase family protein [Neobacillus endophyticus]
MGIGAIVIIAVIVFGGLYYYQATRFNAQISINGINVGGLTADKAIKKLGATVLKNEVYVGQERIIDGNDTKMGFTNEDLPGVQKVLKSQQTIFPTSKAKNYILLPKAVDQYRSQTLKDLVKNKLIAMNKNLKAPVDADVRVEQGAIVVSKSINGKQYDIEKLLQQYQNHEYRSVIQLNPVYIQPIKENSAIIKQKQKALSDILQRTVNYTVQDKAYALKGSDLIKNATLSKDGQISIDPGEIKNEMAKINASQSTLNKNFQFKTHSGAIISVKGQTYGWALDVNKESKRILDALEKGQNSVVASNIYGNGWDNEAIGYKTTMNNGIGNTYAEVSINEQRIWLYRNGQMVLTTNVVTGRADVNQDTHPGVWYILYKKSPSILVGSEYGMVHYRVPVNYWAPFTNDGEGFHDASWRTNWSSTAYIHAGSGGCVNTPPSIMKEVYNNLSTYEPVIIY